jgi:hypothetical protein
MLSEFFLWLLPVPRRSKWGPTPKIYNFYFKSDFEKVFNRKNCIQIRLILKILSSWVLVSFSSLQSLYLANHKSQVKSGKKKMQQVISWGIYRILFNTYENLLLQKSLPKIIF